MQYDLKTKSFSIYYLIQLLNFNNPNIEKQTEDLTQQLKTKAKDILINNIGKYLKPLLDTGVMNTETKNQLNIILENLKQYARSNEIDASMNYNSLDPNGDKEIKEWQNKII